MSVPARPATPPSPPRAPGASAAIPPAAQSAADIEAEVRGNILAAPAGSHTFADDALPEEFLRRETDRIIRESFNQRHRIVVRDPAAKTKDGNRPATGAPANAAAPGGDDAAVQADDESPLRVIEQDAHDPDHAALLGLPEAYPSCRGFRPLLPDEAGQAIPFAPVASAADGLAGHVQATMIIAQRLARDGLLPTMAAALEALQSAPAQDGFKPLVQNHKDERTAVQALRNAGFPVDLLAHFSLDGQANPHSIARYVLERLGEGHDAAALANELRNVPFQFHATQPDFRVASESGEEAVGLLRLQCSRGDYFFGPGDGGNFDLADAVAGALPDTAITISVQQRWAEPLLARMTAMAGDNARSMTVVVEPGTVSQWAQDNGKPGTIGLPVPPPAAPSANAPQVQRSRATLVPRYASRGELGALFIPGEMAVLAGLADTGMTLIHSPLLFHGGNLLAVCHPRSGERILLIGEADIHRNTALGLTAAQVVEAFTLECGVDRCIVLPSVSFHIDYDVTVRAHGDKLLAFVNDHDAARRMILRAGLQPLVEADLIEAETLEIAQGHLDAGREREFMQLVAPAVLDTGGPIGRLPLSLAERFSTGPADSGVGNFQVFLAALDELLALTLREDELPVDPHAAAHLRSLRRLAQDRAALHNLLREAGFTLVPIPSLSLAERSVNHINGIHAPGVFLMPACGGLFAAVDDAAATAFSAALGPDVRIEPIPSAESQRRVGAVHCSVSVYPM